MVAKGKLPPALFTVGTKDQPVDDTVLLSLNSRLMVARRKAKFIEGAPHRLQLLDPGKFVIAKQGTEAIVEFVNAKTERY